MFAQIIVFLIYYFILWFIVKVFRFFNGLKKPAGDLVDRFKDL